VGCVMCLEELLPRLALPCIEHNQPMGADCK
jgi:hypothetical protein